MKITVTVGNKTIEEFRITRPNHWARAKKDIDLIVSVYISTTEQTISKFESAHSLQGPTDGSLDSSTENGSSSLMTLRNPNATGKKILLLYGEQRVTGNMAGSLEVISSLGRPVTSPALLITGLRNNPRVDLGDISEQSARNQIRTLRSAGFLSEAGGLTTAGLDIIAFLEENPFENFDSDRLRGQQGSSWMPEDDLPF